MDEATIEHRLAILERKVADLKSRFSKDASNRLNELIGSISDEFAFLEALEYGRTFRQIDAAESDDAFEQCLVRVKDL